MEEFVVLVDQDDQKLGLMEKQQAHVAGLLHRAFSVFVFNSKGELMIQQRAASKYHSPTLWTNTCCSHPRDNETYEQAAHRRLEEEMGFDCELEYKFNFIYKAHLENDLIEHELDHVFIGTFDDEPKLNPDEVMAYRWVELDDLKKDMEKNPQNYTAWFKIIFEHYVSYIEE
ncbi:MULTISPECIES: isopentenyl-diphosphate Delta-isomerase [Empedobacter]|uniref:Isopentenyl-diphosphate delta-isomerase n=2 Tax=Empedobacter TaxID=59734 RepID=A0A376GFA2_9FLAO|nr:MULTISPECIES: isopentenyl-diphosphate Delta-isomerase [Empedobacter]HAR74541.1 isopentenyl-diphosphate delta-isomerase [Flavobacteriaceae bacterium]MBW1617259.1 isopentenyl-diphosphate Delta-isomerase [Empedobacter falsenii]MDH1883625.1 isopentenyl-diphosphate Delta-isomerase [Empedobacter sp. GD03797]MDM1041102.1 isopentenyl-diphosphate Delta-isomerase [Empedobacter brevis]MDM1134834.1 isopentenyl-diphosphate Delta-isomerase [Empedobacter sp. R750]